MIFTHMSNTNKIRTCSQLEQQHIILHETSISEQSFTIWDIKSSLQVIKMWN